MHERPLQPVPHRLATSVPSRTLRLAALPTAPHMARVFVSHTARQMGLSEECAETARLLVSELVTNAVKQTGRVDGPPIARPAEQVSVVVLSVRLRNGLFHMGVWDADPTPPEKVEASLDDETGRGLFLVQVMSAYWGVHIPQGAAPAGKVVWCEVPTK